MSDDRVDWIDEDPGGGSGIEMNTLGENGGSSSCSNNNASGGGAGAIAGGNGHIRRSETKEELLACLNRWEHPWLLQFLVTVLISAPALLAYTQLFAQELMGRMWTALVYTLHLVVSIRTSRYQAQMCKDNSILGLPGAALPPTPGTEPRCRKALRIVGSILWKRPYPQIMLVLDAFMFGFVYPTITSTIAHYLMTDFDGTPIAEWQTVL